ncbi:PilZ domain-containing protein [Thiohalophilus sp.]|uniref:PilZ domain-containing protein n=1 Tax=Thiohalophilus sp. TaxID=3028392 RepID=UPI002ACED0C0|nr:PilZ domain-containing protein [Thiohalophilus sp.]MDZ7805428.1 PilZ domain-containing protein [Thiohalophilus sp.]
MMARLSSYFDVREKRFQFRKPVPARVRISHSTFGVIQAVTRDISDAGLFVDLRHRLRLPIGAHIKLQFLDSARPEIAFNMKVIRETDEGIALTFVDFEVDGRRYKIDELREHWNPAQH